MPFSTELTSFAIRPGKEARADEWMLALQQHRDACVETLDREAMHFESIFRSTDAGRVWLSWLSVRSHEGAPVATSPFDIDRLHVAFWNECIDRDVPPRRFETVIAFVPAAIERAILTRARDLRPGPALLPSSGSSDHPPLAPPTSR